MSVTSIIGPDLAGTKKPSVQTGRPELLSPAGDWDCARAAVENGADAIYFGLEKFNARMRANNFTVADLPRLMEFLHRRGVRGYVTFNTLVFENELADAEQYLRAIIAAGVDAAIVQDVGICRLIRELSPDFPIHASTQMTVTSAAGVEFARELGCQLVVLARECSIAEIEKIRAAESASGGGAGQALPLEVFVHGALCVAYSGQCLTSESLGGRSANRGECAQACRMPYELIADGQLVPLGDRRYLLSPQDLAGLEVLPDLIRAGVASLKIEGRLKTPEYVANITRIYRQALDRCGVTTGAFANRLPTVAGAAGGGKASQPAGEDPSATSRYDMEMAFSRGLFTGWFQGVNNQALVHARFGKKRGVYLGEVSRVEDQRVTLRLQAPLKAGDGIVFDAGKPDQPEEGGRVYQLEARGADTRLSFGHGDIDFFRVRSGDKVWKTSDPELERTIRQTFAGDTPKFQRRLDVEAHGSAGQPLTLIARDQLGHVARADSTMPLAVAEKQPLTTERLREQLGRLGGTPFHLGDLQNELTGAVLAPVSELNRLRRELVAELDRQRALPQRWQLISPPESSPNAGSGDPASRADLTDCRPGALTGLPAEPELIILVRNLAQLEAALRCGVTTVYCEFEDPKKYREAAMLFHTAYGCTVPGGASGRAPTIWVAPPRVFKTGEDWILKQVRSSQADGYLVRNYEHLNYFAGDRKRGDYSLNVANHHAAGYFKNKFQLEVVTASYDLNFPQLEALLLGAPAGWFEVTIHQHMPMFHMEHCVFCAFLSSGTDYTNCGRPCDHHEVTLRDRVGAEHRLKADAGCRNTVFNSQTQTGAEYVQRLLAEPAAEVERVITKYRQLLRGEITGTQLWRDLKLQNQLGVTRGQMGKV
jgi:U32 family peptidase